jgi:aerobic C4-dicarboxylate transport protein
MARQDPCRLSSRAFATSAKQNLFGRSPTSFAIALSLERGNGEVHMAKAVSPGSRRPWFSILYLQVLLGIALAILLGYFEPKLAVEMKPLGDAFIRLIKMAIGLVIFFTVVSGIGGMQNMKKVGRLGGKALIYFEVVSTLALLIGMVVGNGLAPGVGFNVDPAKLDAQAVRQYAGKAQEQSVTDFLLNIIPNTIVDAFAKGDILPIVLVSIVIGYALARLGEKGRLIQEVIDTGSKLLFAAIQVLMRLAPIGAFGAMAFTIGRYGIGALGPLAALVGVFYLTSAIFVVGVLGVIAAAAGFNVLRLLLYLKDEILIVLGTASSDTVLPSLMEKLQRAGCSKSVVGLVVPAGYVFNADGSSIYITLAALFVAQATNTDLTLSQQLAIFLVAILTSKGASGVTGAGFIALVATLSVVPTIPLAGMALILGIDRFMSEARALVNMIGNAVATVVMAAREGELDRDKLRLALDGLPAAEHELLPVAAPPGIPETVGAHRSQD